MDKYLKFGASILGIDDFGDDDDFDDDNDIDDEYAADDFYYEDVSDGVSFGNANKSITVHQVGNSSNKTTLSVEKNSRDIPSMECYEEW